RIIPAGAIRVTAYIQAACQEVRIGRARERGEIAVFDQAREPGVVHHDDVISAGAAGEIQQLFLKQVGVGELDDLDAATVGRGPFAGGGLECVTFDSRVDGDGERG